MLVFQRIICGVDGSEPGFEAVRQAMRLRAPDATLTAVAVAEVELASHAGFAAPTEVAQLQKRAEQAAGDAAELLAEAPAVETRVVRGRAIPSLLAVALHEEATLVAVGSRGGSRAAGIAFGSVATSMLHYAPCSVLVARTPTQGERFPSAIVLGVDGSPGSADAAVIAHELEDRFGGEVRPIAAEGGKGVDAEAVRRLAGDVQVDPRSPVDALVEASESADLIVLGSRGLHGFSALGSVSERVAHKATCSVLVVRLR